MQRAAARQQSIGNIIPRSGPYPLLPCLASPLSAAAASAPAVPPPRRCGEWTLSTHLLPAAFPRSHPACLAATGRALPRRQLIEDERAQRAQDFATWDEACAEWHASEFLPPASQQAADERAAQLAEAQKESALWGVVQRWKRDVTPREGVVMVFAHANGFHKEIFEPTLAALAEKSTVPIAEMWSMDCVDSGFAGVLNAPRLGMASSWDDHARDINTLIRHLPQPGTDAPALLQEHSTTAQSHRVVGVGHSFSGAGFLRAGTAYSDLLDGIVLVDAVIPAPELAATLSAPSQTMMARAAIARKDVFASREAAAESFRSKPYFQAWDPRILDLHVEHNLVPLSGSSGGPEVTLAMPKFREAAAFANSWCGAIGRAAGRERKHSTKIHTVVLRESNLGNADERAKQVSEIRSWGAGHSAAELPGGHLIAQEHPERLAKHLAEVLHQWYAASSAAPRAARM